MDNLPEWLTWIAVGVGTIIATVVARLGLTSEKKTPDISGTTRVGELSGAIVDSGSMNRNTAAIEAHNMSTMEANIIQKHNNKLLDTHNDQLESLTKSIDDITEELSRVREEIRISREIARN